MKTIRSRAIFNNAEWASIPEKLQKLKDKAAPYVDLEYSVIHTSFNDIPFVSNGPTTKEIPIAWLEANIVPLMDGYDSALLTLNNSQWQGGEENGATYTQLPCISVIHADEDDNCVFDGIENPLYKAWYERAQHEVLGHSFSELTGRIPDDTHSVEALHRLDSPEALSRYDWSRFTSVAEKNALLTAQVSTLTSLIAAVKASIANLLPKKNNPLVEAIIKVESNDVNAKLGTHYKAENMLNNRADSIKLFTAYMNIWCSKDKLGHSPTLEDMARVWNGGPNGWKNQATVTYWNNVKKYL